MTRAGSPAAAAAAGAATAGTLRRSMTTSGLGLTRSLSLWAMGGPRIGKGRGRRDVSGGSRPMDMAGCVGHWKDRGRVSYVGPSVFRRDMFDG
ncbi:hypothetical protein GCM10009099_35380 [Caenispirillum bisanense]